MATQRSGWRRSGVGDGGVEDDSEGFTPFLLESQAGHEFDH
jgi:hypothetical protein